MVDGPQVGDLVWSSAGYYRRIVSVDERLPDGRLKVYAKDPHSGSLVAMAVTLPEEKAGPTAPSGAKRARFRPTTPEQRAALADGFLCRSRGHDLTKPLEDGKPATTPSGRCRQCAREQRAAK